MAGEVLVAFESDKRDLTDAASSGTNVFLHDNRGGGKTILLSTNTDTGAPGNGGSRRPRISPSGALVVFETDATNLDTERKNDRNKVTDDKELDRRM